LAHTSSASDEVTLHSLLANSPKNWNRWGPDDETGSLNFLTSAEVLRGARSVRQGKVFTLGERVADPRGDPVIPARSSAFRVNVMDKSYYDAGRGIETEGGLEYADDHISMFVQGSTHFDALGHVWFDDQIWNGYPAASTIGGLAKASILPLAERGIVGRGILLDMAAYKGTSMLEHGETLGLSDIESAAHKQGIKIEKHDIVCLRLGFLQLFYQQGKDVFKNLSEPGLTYSPELVDWFYRMEIPALCTDSISNEASVDPNVGVALTLHAALMRNLGIALNEICNFEKLAKDCRADGQWDFLYAAGPLKIVDGTGAPVNPIAIK